MYKFLSAVAGTLVLAAGVASASTQVSGTGDFVQGAGGTLIGSTYTFQASNTTSVNYWADTDLGGVIDPATTDLAFSGTVTIGSGYDTHWMAIGYFNADEKGLGIYVWPYSGGNNQALLGANVTGDFQGYTGYAGTYPNALSNTMTFDITWTAATQTLAGTINGISLSKDLTGQLAGVTFDRFGTGDDVGNIASGPSNLDGSLTTTIDTIDYTAVPEPAALTIFAAMGAAMLSRRRRRA